MALRLWLRLRLWRRGGRRRFDDDLDRHFLGPRLARQQNSVEDHQQQKNRRVDRQNDPQYEHELPPPRPGDPWRFDHPLDGFGFKIHVDMRWVGLRDALQH